MATETSRTYDEKAGTIVLGIENKYGHASFHTIYVTGVADIEADIAQRLAEADEQAETIRARMIASGWTPQ